MTDLVVRPMHSTDEFLSLSDPGLVGVASTGRDFTETLRARQYRPEWTYVALRGDTVVARAAWWGGPDDDEPYALDWFDPGDDPEAGAALLRAAPFTGDVILILPADWRDRPDVRAAADARIAAAALAGRHPTVERLRYVWTPADGLPPRPARLTYTEASSDDEVRAVLRDITAGSLDDHTRRAVERLGLDAAVDEQLEDLKWMPSPRAWWRFGRDGSGAVAGFVAPGRNYASPIIGFVGVVPQARGHGYAFDLLAEATHLLVAEGVERVAADTDTTNTPMAATFDRAGYPVVQRRLIIA